LGLSTKALQFMQQDNCLMTQTLQLRQLQQRGRHYTLLVHYDFPLTTKPLIPIANKGLAHKGANQQMQKELPGLLVIIRTP
jgi:hypothetical protein